MHDSDKLMEGIDAAMERQGLVEDREPIEEGVFTGFREAFKANPRLLQRLTDGAVDGMAAVLRFEGVKKRGDIEAFKNMVRGSIEKAITDVARTKLV